MAILWLVAATLSLQRDANEEGVARNPMPVQPLAAWCAVEDYPAEAIMREEQGRVRVRLEISTDGAPMACVVEESAGQALDDATCAVIISRARFQPARDASGRPIGSVLTTSIAWRLPEIGGRLPFLPLRIVNVLTLGPDDQFVCQRQGNDATGYVCGVGLAMGLDAVLRRRGAGAQLTMAMTMAPNGTVAPPAEGLGPAR